MLANPALELGGLVMRTVRVLSRLRPAMLSRVFLVALLVFGTKIIPLHVEPVSAGIVHTVLNRVVALPDSDSLDIFEPIDLNGDGQDDLNIKLDRGSTCVCLPGDPMPPYHLAFLVPGTGASNQQYIATYLPVVTNLDVTALSENSVIGSGMGLVTLSEGRLYHSATEFPDAVPYQAHGEFGSQLSYIGFSADLDGGTKFGWIGIHFELGTSSFGDPGTATIVDFAFEDSGNPIVAGQINPKSGTDLNGDGVTNREDVSIWDSAYGLNSAGDVNGDGISSSFDLLAIQRAMSLSTIASPVTTVPEPGGFILMLSLLISTSIIRRADHRRRDGTRH